MAIAWTEFLVVIIILAVTFLMFLMLLARRRRPEEAAPIAGAPGETGGTTMTASADETAAPEPEWVPQRPEDICPWCGKQLKHMEAGNRYYCPSCKKWMPKPLEETMREDPARARRYARLAYVSTLLLVLVVVIAAVGRWNVGVDTTYPVRQAIEWNWRARATNNLVDMAGYLNRSLELLEPYHGNPCWWFPTPDTNLDQIRLNVEESRDTALAVAAAEPIGSFGYQQAVQNLQETIIEINEHLDLAKGWYVTTQAAVVLALLYVLFTFLTPGLLAASYRWHKTIVNPALGAFVVAWLAGTIAVGVILAIMP